MSDGHTHRRFLTTRWSLIIRARDSGRDLDDLLRMYRSPVYAFIRGSGRSPDDAEDLTQEFLTSVVIKRDFVHRADPSRGTFRGFLRKSLRNFLIDRRRPRSQIGMSQVDPEVLGAMTPSPTDDPTGPFDEHYAATLLSHVVTSLEEDCRQDGMDRHWRVLEARVLDPIRFGSEPVNIDALVEEVDARSPQVLYSMLQTMKRKFTRTLRECVAETVDSEAQLDQEVTEILAALGVTAAAR